MCLSIVQFFFFFLSLSYLFLRLFSEQCEEYAQQELKAKYAEVFLRGNNVLWVVNTTMWNFVMIRFYVMCVSLMCTHFITCEFPFFFLGILAPLQRGDSSIALPAIRFVVMLLREVNFVDPWKVDKM